MSNELKVSFYLKRNEVKSDGTVPITGRITVGKSMVQFSAKCSVQVSLWYGISFNHLKRFLREKYNVVDIPFQMLDYSFIESYDFYLRVQLKFKPNTIVGIIGHLKIIVRRAVNEGVLSRNPFVGFSMEAEPLKPKSISRQELRKIMNTPLDSPNRYHGTRILAQCLH